MAGSVYCPETDSTYVSLDAWRVSEAGVLFKTAEITGDVDATDFNVRDDEFIGGALITAATGQEFSPANINGTHARALGMIRFVSRNTAIYHNISNIEVKSLDLEFATSNDTPNAWAYNCYINPDSGSNIDGIAEFVNSTTGYIEKCIVNGGGSGSNFDGIYSARSSGNQLGVKNCLVVDCGRYGVLRTVISNTLSIGSRLGDYLGEVSMEYSASGDSTADGVGAITGATYADLVDYDGGDWRTSSSSSLATGGEGGSFIGVALEDGSAPVDQVSINTDIALPSPIFSINLTTELPAPTSDINLNVSSPIFSIESSVELPEPVSNLSLSIGQPVFSIKIDSELPEPSVNSDVTIPPPAFSISIESDIPAPEAVLSLSLLTPIFSVKSSVELPSPELSINVNVQEIIFSVDIASSIPEFNSDISLTISSPIFSVETSTAIPAPTGEIDISMQNPVFSVTMQLTVANIIVQKTGATINYSPGSNSLVYSAGDNTLDYKPGSNSLIY